MIYLIKKKIRELSHRNSIIKQLYLLFNRIKTKSLSWLSDELFAKIKYKENTGLSLNLENPKRYNEKLWWLKINYRNPLMTICSDKYKVREYVERCGLSHILTKNYGVFENADQINFEEFPEKAIIKCNHVSGVNAFYNRNKPFDRKKFIKLFNSALKRNYYLQSREWNYKNISPKIIVEEFLENKDGSKLIDYRFMCFNGRVKLVLIDVDTMASDGTHDPYAKRNIYDLNFTRIDMKIGRDNFNDESLDKPNNFEEMIEYAEILSNPFPHCRVDLYNVDGKIYFGEITFYPGGSTQKITPQDWDFKMGEWIDMEIID